MFLEQIIWINHSSGDQCEGPLGIIEMHCDGGKKEEHLVKWK